MRLFRSPWSYLGSLALVVFSLWNEARPHASLPVTPWHPVFFGWEFAIANAFCICLLVGASRLTWIITEKAALALLTMEESLSILRDLHSAQLIRLPSVQFAFLTLNGLLAILLGVRFFRVFHDPPVPGILSRVSTPTE